MKELLLNSKKYFTTWWIPIIGNFLAIGIFLLGILFKRDWIIYLFLLAFLLNVLGTAIASIVQIAKGRWYFIIPQLGLAALFIFYFGTIFTYSPPDFFGAHKELPEGIPFSEPLDSIPSNDDLAAHCFILTNYSQPGIYLYHTNITPKEQGYFFVKAFEVTTNHRLSADRMQKTSKIEVKDLEPKRYEGKFTIYEGDWGDKYGSRIELWYQPSTGMEAYKLCERHFIVEGWQR